MVRKAKKEHLVVAALLEIPMRYEMEYCKEKASSRRSRGIECSKYTVKL